MVPSVDEKLKVIKEKNTYFTGASPEVEAEYQAVVEGTVAALKKWKQIVEAKPDEATLQKLLAQFISSEEYGLKAALTLCGLSNEKMFRIFSFLRAMYTRGIYKTSSSWVKEEIETGEWKEDAILSKLRSDSQFALDFASILLGKEALINKIVSPFERKYLKKEKFLFVDDELLDALARYNIHGSYSAAKGVGPEQILKEILDKMEVLYTSGKIRGVDRRIDLIIPSKENPKLFVEIAYVETTSSGMGDKAKAERDTVGKSIRQNYKGALFVLFVDGAGWLVREEAMRIMCEAADYVFTFHPEQLEEFKKLVSKTLSKEDYRPSLSRFFQSRKS
jgi:hypothetical protein